MLTNYAELINQQMLVKSGKEFIKNCLCQTEMTVEFSNETFKNMKEFNVESIEDRLTKAFIEVSYNNSVLALLIFALMQRSFAYSLQK